jgi:hypothetical protein
MWDVAAIQGHSCQTYQQQKGCGVLQWYRGILATSNCRKEAGYCFHTGAFFSVTMSTSKMMCDIQKSSHTFQQDMDILVMKGATHTSKNYVGHCCHIRAFYFLTTHTANKKEVERCT